MRNKTDWRIPIVVIALVATAWSAALILTANDADAATVDSAAPYGGCGEAWPHYVHTDGAQDCRDRGWVIRGHLTISPNGHALTDLPRCAEEDSHRCYWNALRMGNGSGRGFVTAGQFRWYVDTIHRHRASTDLFRRYDRYWL